MKILAIIPARGGSKGVPKKNIKLLNGKPLLQYTSEVALKSNFLSKVILSSDDDEIITLAKKLGIDVPFKRPESLANDSAPTLPVIQHALQFLKEEKKEEYDAICLLQVTSPMRTAKFLDQAIQTFIEKETDSLISVQRVPHEYNPHWTFIKDKNDNLSISTGDSKIISRRQNLPDAYHRDGSIYLTRVETILRKNSLYGDTIAFIESPAEFYLNIDTEYDWSKAENLFHQINKNKI